MNLTYKPILIGLIVSTALAGCASTSDLNALRAEVVKAQQTADSARDQAAAAHDLAQQALNQTSMFNKKADDTRSLAASANQAAQQAERAAQAAAASAKEANERLDRAFKKSMQK